MLAPVIFIGCGGSGVLSVRHIRDEVRSRLKAHGIDKIPQAWQFIGFDTVRTQSRLADASPLPSSDFLSITGGIQFLHQLEPTLKARFVPNTRSPGYEEIINWRPDPPELPGNVELGAGQMRAVGRILATNSLSNRAISTRLQQALIATQAGGAELAAVTKGLQYPVALGESMKPPIVAIIGSSAGGTGAGLMLDVVDVLQRTSAVYVEPLIVVYGSDIFGEKEQAPMAANSLMFMSEMINAYHAKGGGKQGVFAASVSELLTRGPRGTMMIGRKNLASYDLKDSRIVYRAVALAMAGWVTDPHVAFEVQENIIGNWNTLRRTGGIGFGTVKGSASSFGSASVSIGRSMFRSYARAYLMRDLYEHHSDGFLKLAESTLGIGKSRGGDDAVKLNLVNHFMPDYMRELGLVNTFDSDFRIKAGPDAQVSEALLSKDSILVAANEYKAAIFAKLPTGNIKGAEWRRQLDDHEGREGPSLSRIKIEAYALRQAEWNQALAEKVINVTNSYLARVTLPVMSSLLPQAVAQIQGMANDFKSAAVQANSQTLVLKESRNKFLNNLGSGNFTKESPNVGEALTAASQVFAQQLKHEISILIARTLEQAAMNLLNPLRAALMLAEANVSAMTTVQYLEPKVISAWPTEDVVPNAFAPSDVEFLLEEYSEWPSILRSLLEDIEGKLVGESTISAVRRSISGNSNLVGGELIEGSVEPLLWLKEGRKVEFSASSPLALKIGLEREDLEDRIDNWLMRDGHELARRFSEGLSSFLSDESKIDRLKKFETQFNRALEQAQPLCEVDMTYYKVVYPNSELTLTAVIEPLPFAPGHPAYAIAEAQIRNHLKLGDGPIDKYVGDRDIETAVITNFIENPIFPGMIRSFTEPIARYGNEERRKGKSDFRTWLAFKRARTLDEVIPFPPDVVGAIIRGFAVARLLGMATKDVGEGSQVQTNEGPIGFPDPAFAPFDSSGEFTVTSILMSIPLSFIDLPTKREKAFLAYKALFGFGVPADDLVQVADFRVAGELKQMIDDGSTVLSAIDNFRFAEITGGENTPASRKAEMIAILNSQLNYFEKLKNEPYTGDERVREDGTIVSADDTTNLNTSGAITREIVVDLIRQYGKVRDAIAEYTIGTDTSKSKLRG